MAKGEPPRCFVCHKVITFSDQFIGKNGKKIPLDPETEAPHDCPMRKKDGTSYDNNSVAAIEYKREQEDKDDHGNESYSPVADVGEPVAEGGIKYVDHTATTKGQSKVKIFYGTQHELEELYNAFLAENHGKIKTQGAQFQVNEPDFAIALYYEETK